MRKTILLVSALMLSVGPAGASGPQIADPEGDSNGLPGNVDTRPASYDPADILSVTLSTEYVSVPVGSDGVDHRPTALLVRFRTLGEPRAEAGNLAFGIHTQIGDCDSSFVGYVRGRMIPINDGQAGKARWVQFGDCPNRPSEIYRTAGFGTAVDHPSWTAAADLAARTVTVRFPLDTLTSAQAGLLRPGARLSAPSAQSFASRSIYIVSDAGASAPTSYYDGTDQGTDFVLASDVPPDVPCTRSCP